MSKSDKEEKENGNEHFSLEKKDQVENLPALRNQAVLERVEVLPNGKLKIAAKDMQDLFADYVSEYWAGQILTIGLSGNRQALRAKLELYKAYFLMEVRTKDKFVRLAKMKGYRIEAIEDLWADLNDIYLNDFVEFIKNKISPPKKKEDGFMTL